MDEVVSGEAVVIDLPCARFPSRMLAIFIDILVQAALGGLLLGIAAASGAHLNDAAVAAVTLTAVIFILAMMAIFLT